MPPLPTHLADDRLTPFPAPRLSVCLLVTFLGLISGCSSLASKLTSQDKSETAPRGPKPVELTYRTDSGRLNQVALGRSETQQVSFQQPAGTPVPPFTTSTLRIQHPHPAGVRGSALVTVTFAPRTSDSDDSDTSSIWNAITGESTEETANAKTVVEAWQIEIPDWQLASLMSQLKEMHYFQRVKVFGSEADITTNIDGNRFDKEFSAVPELDAMIVNIRRQGRRVDGGAMVARPPMQIPSFAMPPYPAPHAALPHHGHVPPPGSQFPQPFPQVPERPVAR